MKELAECSEAGLPLTPEEAERLEAHRNRKKTALQDLKARAETDPEAAAELARKRAYNSDAEKLAVCACNLRTGEAEEKLVLFGQPA